MYVAENNLDFYKLLSENDHSDIIDDTNLCLITMEELNTNHITLDCNHKFNYMPLLKDMYTRLYLSHEVKCLHRFPLNVNVIECPYCRRSNNYILPFIKEEYDVKIYGINSNVHDDMIQEINIPFYDIHKCSVGDCHRYCYKGFLLPFCNKHVTDKKLIKNHKNELKRQYLIEHNMLCEVILKSGTRKDEKCNQRCEIGGYCKRHKESLINSTIG